MKKKQKPFELKNLLKDDKALAKRQAFEQSDIKKDMLSGKLEPGEQIWIYHDRRTNPCNPVAWVNKYAHVVVYIGKMVYMRLSTSPRHPGQED